VAISDRESRSVRRRIDRAPVREPQEKAIRGHVYLVKPLGAKIGNRVLMRLGKAVLSAMADAQSLTTLEGAVSAISALLSTLSEQDMEFVINALAEETLVCKEGEEEHTRVTLKNIFDSHFAGEYGKQAEWLAFALEVNFDFLDGLRTRVDEWKTKKKAA
jgi:hypothetical protein